MKKSVHQIWKQSSNNTVEHGRNISQKVLGEHKVITPEKQFLGIILCFFMYSKWLWLLSFSAKMLLSNLNFLYFYDFELK